MSAQRSSNSKPSKPPNPNRSSTTTTTPTTTNATTAATSSLSSHLAMVELKQRILTSLSKLSDRDTHQIAVDDLEKTIQSLPSEAVPMLLNCLYDASFSDPKPAVKKESLRLIAAAAAAHSDAAGAHLPKILAHVVRRLKDADSALREACRDAVGALASQYLGPQATSSSSMVGVFVRPFFEAMAEQNKGLQAGAAMCVARAVECSSSSSSASSSGLFSKLCPRISKLLNSPNFLAKAALLPVVSTLAQVGAIAPQSLENLLQSIHDCIGSSDWATRKAAADALVALASHARNLIAENTSHTLAVLEASRFDKIKPVRESMTEALQLWKSIAGKGDGSPEDRKASTNENCQPNDSSEKGELKNQKQGEKKDLKSSPNSPSALDSENKSKGGTAVILKKKAPGLSDKDINPEFFHRLEARVSDDLPVEVIVPRRHQNSSNEPERSSSDSKARPGRVGDETQGASGIRHRSLAWDKWSEERATNGKDSRSRQSGEGEDRVQREYSGNRAGFSKTDGQSDGSFANNKGNWLAIQRQLLQLERQQGHLMNMLQDFMGGSHDSMITLENRVRGLERVVEDMARDLSISSGNGGGRRGGNFGMGFEGSNNNRALGKYNNGFSDGARFGERFSQTDGSVRGRGSHWRSEITDGWDFPSYGGASRSNGQSGPRRAPGSTDKGGSGAGPARFGEGPSARSVWQASKDEATLEAIRVAGDDNNNNNGASAAAAVARAAPPERVAEAMMMGEGEGERDPVWAAWGNAMDALRAGDADSAYAEVLSAGDDLLLVKLMDRTGPVIDQLSNEIANETLNALLHFFADQNLFDICLSWAQQLAEVVAEHGGEILGMTTELKREMLLTLHDASLAMDPPEDWEGPTPDQIVLQLASSWDIDLHQNHN